MKKLIFISCIVIVSWITMAQASLPIVLTDTIQIDTIAVEDSIAPLNDSIVKPLIIDCMPHALVYQDSLITQLMRDKRMGYVRGEHTKDGFRVQIYASNQQQVAKKEATELQQRIESQIEIPIYILSEPPFWKVRIGNFATREDANNYKTLFLQIFPELTGSTYVVSDKIIILQ